MQRLREGEVSSAVPAYGDLCVLCLTDVVLPTHPPGTLVGDTPTPPAVGHRPSALPHSRGYASRPRMSYAKVS